MTPLSSVTSIVFPRVLPTVGRVVPEVNFSLVQHRFFTGTSMPLLSELKPRVFFLDKRGKQVTGTHLESLKGSLGNQVKVVDRGEKGAGTHFISLEGREFTELSPEQWEGVLALAEESQDLKLLWSTINRYWINRGRDINELKIGSYSILHAMINRYDFGKETGNIIDELFKLGAKPQKNEYYVGPIADAVISRGGVEKKRAVIKVLLEQGCELNQTFYERTPLDFAFHLTTDEGRSQIYSFLVLHGAQRFKDLKLA